MTFVSGGGNTSPIHALLVGGTPACSGIVDEDVNLRLPLFDEGRYLVAACFRLCLSVHDSTQTIVCHTCYDLPTDPPRRTGRCLGPAHSAGRTPNPRLVDRLRMLSDSDSVPPSVAVLCGQLCTPSPRSARTQTQSSCLCRTLPRSRPLVVPLVC